MNSRSITAAAVATVAGFAVAQPVVDGTLDAALYGAPLTVQTNPTGFGNNDEAGPDFSTGSEINAVYAFAVLGGDNRDTIAGNEGRLYIMLTGNIESNFNKIDLFLDVQDGSVIPGAGPGQNQLTTLNVDVDFNGLNRMGGPRDIDDDGDPETPPVSGPGLKFDEGFAADYWIAVTNGRDENGTPDDQSDDFVAMFGNAAVIRTDGALIGFDYGAFFGGPKADIGTIDFSGDRVDTQDGSSNLFTNYGPRLTANDPANPIPGLLEIAIDNSNTGGVSGLSNGVGTNSGAADVTTGIEICIDLEEAGWDGQSPVKLAGFVNGTGHDFLANQVIGNLPATEIASCSQADINNDGSLDIFDILGFFDLFGAGDLDADFNNDDNLDIFDILAFFDLFGQGGCDGTPAGVQGSENLGEPSLVDFTTIDGQQFIVIPLN